MRNSAGQFVATTTPTVSLVKDSPIYDLAFEFLARSREYKATADRHFFGTLDWATKTELVAGFGPLVRVGK